MHEYYGEDLLHVFEKLTIDLGGLHPNVVKAWFDTDCSRIKSLLTFLCSEISEENCIPAQEENEFNELDNVLNGAELEDKVEKVIRKYPSILNINGNTLEIKVLQDEIELLEDEIRDYHHQIEVHKKLEAKLEEELSTLLKEDIHLNVDKENSETLCLQLGIAIDHIALELYEDISKYQDYVYDLQLNINPEFESVIKEKFNETASCISTTCDSSINEQSIDKSSDNILSELQKRLFQSHLNLLKSKMELNQLENVLEFLNNCTPKFHAINCDQSEAKLDTLRSQKNFLMDILADMAMQRSKHQMSCPRLKSAQNDLQICLTNVSNLNKIDEILIKLLGHYIILHQIYQEENSDLKSLVSFFCKIVSFINEDITNCKIRTKKMLNIIEDYKTFSSLPFEKQYIFAEECQKVLADKPLSNFSAIADASSTLRCNINMLEKKIFLHSPHEHFKSNLPLVNNLNVIEEFLRCGPTCRIITIPFSFQKTCLELNSNLKKQADTIKQALQIMQNAKGSALNNKKFLWQSKLWQYFLVNPAKMLQLLQKVEKETIGAVSKDNDINDDLKQKTSF